MEQPWDWKRLLSFSIVCSVVGLIIVIVFATILI
jgi:hypothetical protein